MYAYIYICRCSHPAPSYTAIVIYIYIHVRNNIHAGTSFQASRTGYSSGSAGGTVYPPAVVNQDFIETQPATFPAGWSANPPRESGLMHTMSSGSITSEGTSPACPFYPRETGLAQPPPRLLGPGNTVPSQVPVLSSQPAGQVQLQVPLPSETAVPDQRAALQVPTQVPLPAQPNAVPNQLPSQVPSEVPLLSQLHGNWLPSQLQAQVPLPSQPHVPSAGQVQPPSQPTEVPLLSQQYPVPNLLPSQVPAQVPLPSPLLSQSQALPTQVPAQVSAAAATHPGPLPRQLEAEFDAAAFEKELEQQMQIDEISDQLECRKRKYESDLQDLEQQSQQALLKHREFLRGLDEEYNERCRKHKLELIRLQNEERMANDQANAAKDAL